MTFQSIRKKNLYEEIVSQLIQYVQREGMKPGDKLPTENELVDMFQVSKTAVREALSVLAAKGMLEKKAGVGSILKEVTGSTFVDQITNHLIVGEQSLREILEFRRAIEVEAASLSAERASSEQIEAIENAHLQLIDMNRKGGIGIDEDFRFHYLIIMSSGNSIYESIFDFISGRFLEAIKISKTQSKELSKRYLEEAHGEHERILRAIKARDPEEARLAMLEHLQKNETKIWSHELHIDHKHL
ncbi:MULTISPECIES: FadR/GntR family transcriptional regulator [unclassified Paenibacillus]|uniref:FadR/GntR family transcriptional regulator n=1 Tax=unclassified Paenibacillus TaxID=185978 RepID=UPI001AE1BB95|nr:MULTISPECIES: FadR/GntR family transcriptional regulator [unclassified Paenibacillus]MBP1154271.1 GntR family transcriptional repressor for pyruvate dehydrogenase complex [Paenibacillus sp. PvP091]MBP1170344.1 GntR family transcriptional repressor for pyruvate dehydrogenase complex [Paenibacillus sp. PvR098]MBP2441372.1 GntR family transcriptional repressor for pyruvate dehydrogenase complex [Paenibacillus sp. PvP052]